jgi:hypothetical protein
VLVAQIGEYPVGSLVRVRERDWVVLPSHDDQIICLRPLRGSESEMCGIHRAIEGGHLRARTPWGRLPLVFHTTHQPRKANLNTTTR